MKVTRWLNLRVNHAHSNLTGNTYNIFTSETILEATHDLWFICHLIFLVSNVGIKYHGRVFSIWFVSRSTLVMLF